MKSPIISHFVVSTADDPRTVGQMKNNARAEMKKKIEAAEGPKEIRFTFTPLDEPRSGLVMNITWEVRADF